MPAKVKRTGREGSQRLPKETATPKPDRRGVRDGATEKRTDDTVRPTRPKK